jgi:hypothetical protein
VTIDLFEPTQPERIREQVVKLRSEGVTEEQITQLIEEHPTKTAVQNAMALHREMVKRGLTSPYVLVTEPPTDCTKLRRYKHPLYKFMPLESYQRPPLA